MVKKIVVILVSLFFSGFIIIQFFQPERNNLPVTEEHLFNQANLPGNIKEILTNSCLDCHSNQTNYQFYHHITPVSWLVDKHINEAKLELNFSEWGVYSKREKIGLLNAICEESSRKEMPLKSYAFIHKKARLTDEDITEVCNWTENYIENLLSQ